MGGVDWVNLGTGNGKRDSRYTKLNASVSKTFIFSLCKKKLTNYIVPAHNHTHSNACFDCTKNVSNASLEEGFC